MTNWFVFCPFGEKAEILRYAQDDQTTVGSERGLLPLPNIGRSFASLRMTWWSLFRPLFSHSELILRGVSSVSPFCHPERSEGSPLFNRGGDFFLLQLYPKEFLPFSGLVGKGSFTPSQYGRSLTKDVRDDTSCRLERGTITPFD